MLRAAPIKSLMLAALVLSALVGPSVASQQAGQPISAMAADAHPSFEVVTIKPADPDARNGNFSIGGHRVSITNQTVNRLISVAYSVHQRQVVDGPQWLETDRYDIDGTADVEGVPEGWAEAGEERKRSE
jgi:hypothetical protein